MRKTICILLVLCTVLAFAACSNSGQPKVKMGDEYYQLGIKALRVIDGYLDSTVSSEDAAASLNSIYRDLERLPDIDFSGDTYVGDTGVQTKLFLISLEFGKSHSSGGVSYSDILDLRDDLADLLGKPSYK